VQDRVGEAATLNNMGRVYRPLGELHLDFRYYEQALAILQDIGDRVNQAVTLNNMVMIHIEEGNLDEAESLILKVIDIDQVLNLPAQAEDRATLAWIH
jgi:tetratricopeptide (TPR) repeat protein